MSRTLHAPRPPARPAYPVTRGARKMESRTAVKEYWSTYCNMRGMAALNKKQKQRRNDMLPLANLPDTNVVKPRAPAYSMQGRTTGNAFEDVNPGPGAYAPKMRGVGAGPRWAPTNDIKIDKPSVPGPGAYSPRLPPGRAATLGGKLQDPTEVAPHLSVAKRSPGPADYHVPGTFGRSKGGFSFGVRTVQKLSQETPGPGSYEMPSSLAGCKFSMGGPNTDPTKLDVQSAPGPGAYDVKGDIEANLNSGRGFTLKGREMLDNRRFPD